MSDWKLIATLALLSFAGWAVAQDAYVAEDFTRDFEFKGSPELIVRNPDGLVLIQTSEAAGIKIHVKKEVWRARDDEEAKREADKVRVEITQFAEKISVSVHHTNRVFSIKGHPKVVVRLEIDAPAITSIDAGVSDGELSVTGFQGKSKLSAADGRIEAKNLSGEVTISASDGKIQAEQLSGELSMRISDGDLHASNCSGNIKIRVSDGTARMEGVSGAVEASGSDGEIVLEGKLTSLTGRVSDGSMEIRISPDSVMATDWSLQSSDGDINLTLPETFSAELQLSAADGSIHTDHPIQVTGSLSRNKLIGKIGEGGHTIQIRTGDGDIALQ